MQFDIAIIGAGPAGCTAAIKLAESGLKIGLFDQSRLPIHKVCGDALSGTVMNVLKRLPGDLYNDFLRLPGIQETKGIRFVAPGKKVLDIPYYRVEDKDSPPAGFLCRRIDFDNFLLGRVRNYHNIQIFEQTKIDRLETEPEAIWLSSDHAEFRASMIIGADGVNSVVRKYLLSGEKTGQPHLCLGVRAYYNYVKDLHPAHFLELHFLKELLPEYLWIFPMNDGVANVGLGMISEKVIKRKIVLGKMLEGILFNTPDFAERFRSASRIGKIEAHELPYGSAIANISGNRTILAGDAASLVNPFTGEGIGNAMISGMIAAEVAQEAFRKQDFSSGFLSTYDDRIKKGLGNDLRISLRIRNLVKFPWLFNFVVDKALKSKDLRDQLTKMYSNSEEKSVLVNPFFYFRLLFS